MREGWRWVASLALAALAACGGRANNPGPGTAGASGNDAVAGASNAGNGGDAGTGDQPSPPAHAENGVEIPSLDDAPPEMCAALQIQIASCETTPCKPIDCPCTPPVHFGDCNEVGRCVSSVSCDAACASEAGAAAAAAIVCPWTGVCRVDADCNGVCLISKGHDYGRCSDSLSGADCFEPADCVNRTCVVTAFGTGLCSGRGNHAPCNQNAHCDAPARCLLEPRAFVGVCSDGAEETPCIVDTDCQGTQRCVDFSGILHCSSRAVGSYCEQGQQCNSGFCVERRCTTGELGATCQADRTDCKSGHCFQVCVSGAVGSECGADEDCEASSCKRLSSDVNTCSAGNLGEACSLGALEPKFCKDAMHCEATPKGNVCVPPSATGTPCSTSTDCESGACSDTPSGGRGFCTEGKLEQHCNVSKGQCMLGLHCVPYVFDGICVEGAVGDPCSLNDDCDSGVCGPPVELDDSAFTDCLTSTGTKPCGNGGACIFHNCVQRTCKSN